MSAAEISVQPVQMFRLQIPQRDYWSQDELFDLRAKIDSTLIPSMDSSYGTVERITFVVSHFYQVPRVQILGRARPEYVAWARHVAMFFIRECLNMPQQEIGNFFGGRDHGTVFNSVQRVRSAIETEPERAAQITQLRELIKQADEKAKTK